MAGLRQYAAFAVIQFPPESWHATCSADTQLSWQYFPKADKRTRYGSTLRPFADVKHEVTKHDGHSSTLAENRLRQIVDVDPCDRF
jgi:hypothetical protein